MRPIEIVIILNLHNKIGLMSGIWHCKENSHGLSYAVIYNGDGFGKWGGEGGTLCQFYEGRGGFNSHGN